VIEFPVGRRFAVSPNSQPFGEIEEKLTDYSRRRARRWLWWVKSLRGICIAAALAGVSPVALWSVKQSLFLYSLHAGWFDKPAAGPTLILPVPGVVQFVLNWELFGWEVSTYLFAAAIVAGGIIPLFDYFNADEKKCERIRDAGLVPRYGPSEDRRPNDNELVETYSSRLKKNEKEEQEEKALEAAGFAVPGVPVYFVLPPHEGFEVLLQSVRDRSDGDAFDEETLSLEAAHLGLDWLGFSKWLLDTKREQWFDRADDLCIRCAKRPEIKNGTCRIDVTDCSYEKYLLTEGAVNLTADTRLPDMRSLFEGKRWDRREVDLFDFAEAGKRFSMLLSVAVLVTTTDNFLVLQRRSNRVAQGLGVITTTSNGFASWRSDYLSFKNRLIWRIRCRGVSNLRNAAFRELYEETGIPRRRLEHTDNAFIGAAFNLLHGRDLNFYAHFKTSLNHHEVARLRKTAKSRWEVGSLIFVPLSKIADDGLSLLEPFDRLLPECARHLRGAIFALAKSGRLNQILEKSSTHHPQSP
jgi:8-oxo-dGTP pyrophosphatase MutT (NUDIX family)